MWAVVMCLSADRKRTTIPQQRLHPCKCYFWKTDINCNLTSVSLVWQSVLVFLDAKSRIQTLSKPCLWAENASSPIYLANKVFLFFFFGTPSVVSVLSRICVKSRTITLPCQLTCSLVSDIAFGGSRSFSLSTHARVAVSETPWDRGDTDRVTAYFIVFHK